MDQTLSRLAARLTALLLLLVSACATAQFDHQHAAWSALLKQHVVVADGGRTSRVRYAGFARDRTTLQNYLAILSAVDRREFDDWTKPRQLAFLLNAYNANMIALILTRYPDLRSVQDFGRIFDNPFSRKFFALLGRPMSLDTIEHEMIRAAGVFDEPRIHFAVNCASIGCPMLREEAYEGDRLDAQLEEQTTRFLSDRARNRYSATDGTLRVSSIFKWYGEDFRRGARASSSLEEFFARHAMLLGDDAEAQSRIAARRAALRFLDYDWRLNDAAR